MHQADRKTSMSERCASPLSEMQALAMDYGRQYDLMDQFELEVKKAKEDPVRRETLAGLEDDMEKKSDLAFRRGSAIKDLLATCQPQDKKDLVIFAAVFVEKFDAFLHKISNQIDDNTKGDQDALLAMSKILLLRIESNSGVTAKDLGIAALWPLPDQG